MLQWLTLCCRRRTESEPGKPQCSRSVECSGSPLPPHPLWLSQWQTGCLHLVGWRRWKIEEYMNTREIYIGICVHKEGFVMLYLLVALLDCLCCFSEVSIEGVLFSTVLARRILEAKSFLPTFLIVQPSALQRGPYLPS